MASLALGVVAVPLQALAQDTYRLTAHTVTIYGTSNVHDWDEKVTECSGSAVLEVSGNSLVRLEEAKVTMPVKSIESGKGKMDSNTFEALKADDHPNLTLKVVSAEISGNTINARVHLGIAGKTNALSVPIDYTASGTTFVASGKLTIDMTSWGVEPPTAMFGSISTGKVVTVDYKLTFSK